MVFRSQFLYPALVASAAVALLVSLNWQCLLLVFLMGGIGWSLWAITGGNFSSADPIERQNQRDKARRQGQETIASAREHRVPDNAVERRQPRLYHFPNRSRFAAK